jgi:hypothetical protein
VTDRNPTSLKWHGILKRRASYMARKANPPPPSPSTLLGSWPTGPKSAIRVSLDEFEGRTFVNLRAWWQRKGGDWRPTRRGVTFPPEAVPVLLEALGKALPACHPLPPPAAPFSRDVGGDDSSTAARSPHG